MEKNLGERITETKGYIAREERVYNMIQAGANLQAFREEKYDFAPGEKVHFGVDVRARTKGSDFVDVDDSIGDLEGRIENRKKEVSEKMEKAREAENKKAKAMLKEELKKELKMENDNG